MLLIGGVLVFQYNRERQFRIDELNARLQTINAEILNDIDNGDEPSSIREAVGDIHGLRVSIIDSAGRVLSDNTLDILPSGNHLRREEITKAVKDGSGYALRRHSESTGLTYFYSATKGESGIIVRTAVEYSVPLSRFLQADYGFIWFTGSLALCLCVAGYFATRRLGQNIERLSRFARKAENGGHISGCESFPHDELGDISSNIVRLYAKLQKTAADRDREHRAALHEQKEKERIKKQLTNNINHELKTPVASIRVCLETLLRHEDIAPEKRREFLSRSLADTDRLTQLLNDVATLTRIEDGASSIARTKLDLSSIIEDIAARTELRAEAKGMAIENLIDRRIYVEGNRMLLESVFRNLLDNAISYSGGTKVSLRIADYEPDSATIEVADDGCGLPEEHLPRIFERFYRIDKGRSRAAGGTGLGLAIVKNSVIFHGGSISAGNAPGGGAVFSVKMPTI